MKNLLLLHGALGAASDFDPLIPKLSSKYNCFAPDLPGHGQSTQQADLFTMESFASFLAQYIKENELSGCSVFGYSMGGYISTYLESKQPSFTALYTLGTKFIWSPESAEKEASYLNPDKILEKVPAYAASLALKHARQDWKQLLEKTATLMRQLGQAPALSEADYSKINIPYMVGLGDQDKMIPLTDAKMVFEQIPTAGLDVLPHTPHPIDKVNSELISCRLNYFFDLYDSSNTKKQ